MFNIHLIVIGKFKEKYWAAAEAEYLKRLKPYAKIRLTELNEEPFRTSADFDKCKQREAQKIMHYIKPHNCVIALHEKGTQYTSIAFADFLKKQSEYGQEMIMVIGGPLGLHEDILARADFTLSLSQLTFVHQMVRPLLLEQIYRAATINSGKHYHY
jgi:23S rRNA (pseudouridine1915-N3)-methyltransferase